MTQDQYIIRRKINIGELGETLGNISEARRKLGVSRQHYYDIKNAIQEDRVSPPLSPTPSFRLYHGLESKTRKPVMTPGSIPPKNAHRLENNCGPSHCN